MLGGGGYNPWATVRAWSGIWGLLNEQNLDFELPLKPVGILRDLKWNHSKGRNVPYNWTARLADSPNIGSVREETNNGKVKKLFIEHYKNMAEKIIYKTALKAEKKWNLDYCYIIHRHGTLKAGESIVMVITCSKHRKEAYAANQYIIDWLKINAPFWKKEIFENEAKWVEQTL